MLHELPKRQCAQVQLDLLESVAVEEMALADLVKAEAETIEALTRHLPVPETVAEAAEMQKLLLAVLQAIHLKELMLAERLRLTAKLRCYDGDESTGSDYTEESDET